MLFPAVPGLGLAEVINGLVDVMVGEGVGVVEPTEQYCFCQELMTVHGTDLTVVSPNT